MSWSDLDPEFRAIAERDGVLTSRQLEVLKLKASGAGWQLIAQTLGLTSKTVREHFDRASLKLRQEVAAQRGVFG
jgi:DNA-binding NarL/FixJ family response regulator